MFCSKCGNKMEDDALFCKNCGAKLVVEPDNDGEKKSPPPIPPSMPESMPTSNSTLSDSFVQNRILIPIIIGIVAVVVIVFLGVNGKLTGLTGGNKYVEMVKGGSPTSFPNKTYGESFNKFFAKPKWEYFKSDDGKDIVQFEGDCTYAGEDAHVVMQFDLHVSEGTFDTYAVEINGNPQNAFIIAGLQYAVFEDEE